MEDRPGRDEPQSPPAGSSQYIYPPKTLLNAFITEEYSCQLSLKYQKTDGRTSQRNLSLECVNHLHVHCCVGASLIQRNISIFIAAVYECERAREHHRLFPAPAGLKRRSLGLKLNAGDWSGSA